MTGILRKAVLVSAAFLLAACADIPRFGGSRMAVESWAAGRGFRPPGLPPTSFDLLALARLRSGNHPLVVYIEGDGAAWPRPDLPPADPTPLRPVALALAAEDRSPSVIYLGRPCQYLNEQQLAHCPPEWWTSRRFSPPVLAAYHQLLDALKSKTGKPALHLIGYSGGGVIATLLAGQRQDVTSLTTVAAPLSLAAWTQWHKVSPLTEAIDPISLPLPSHITAIHYAGRGDDIVPPSIVRSYVRMRGGGLRIIEGAGHVNGWLTFWQRIHGKEPQHE